MLAPDANRQWDSAAHITRHRSSRGMPSSGPEAPLARTGGTLTELGTGRQVHVPTYANADVYVRFTNANVASFTGSIWRLYAIVNGVRSLEAQQTLGVPTALQSVRVLGVRSRGGVDYFEVTVALDPAAGAPPGGTNDQLEVDIVTYDHGGSDNGASPAPPGPVPAGGGSYSTPAAFAQQRIVSAVPVSVKRIAATMDPTNAAPRYLMFFDRAIAPVVGAAPKLTAWVGPGGAASWEWSAMPFLTGLVWAVSTTKDTYTASVDLALVAVEME